MVDGAVITLRPTYNYNKFKTHRLSEADTVNFDRCPICESNGLAPIAALKNKTGEQIVIRSLCRTCGHISFSRRPSAEWIERFYRKEWSKPTTPIREVKANPNYGAISDLLVPLLPDRNAKILDIGCGTGSALKHFSNHGYTRLFGLELSEHRAQLARTVGAKVYNCTAEHLASEPAVSNDAPFDAAFSWHAFEHMFMPRLAIEDVAKVLKPGAHLFICVPHFEAEHLLLQAHFLPHFHSFSPSSLRWLMEQAGFEVIYEDTGLRMIGRKLAHPINSAHPLAPMTSYLHSKLIRDFGVRDIKKLRDARVRLDYTHSRCRHAVLEASWGQLQVLRNLRGRGKAGVWLGDNIAGVDRDLEQETRDSWARAKLKRYIRQRLGRNTLLGHMTYQFEPNQFGSDGAPPRLDVIYNDSSVCIWTK